MRYLIYTTNLGLLLSFIIGELQIGSSESVKMHHAKPKKVPSIAPAPVGFLLSINLNIIYLSYRNMRRNESRIFSAETFETTSSISLKEWKEIEKIIVEESRRAAEDETYSIGILSDIKHIGKDLESLTLSSSEISDCLFDVDCSRSKKIWTLYELLRPFSDYRRKVDQFVHDFLMNTSDNSSTELGLLKFFRDFFFNKQKRNMQKSQYGDSESANTIILKFYMLIAKILTEACSSIHVAHMIHYQDAITEDKVKGAEIFAKTATKVRQKYIHHMEILMSTTKSILKSSVGRIQMSDPDQFIKDSNFYLIDVNDPDVQFSLKSVDAQPGYVVTGMRWRMKEKIVYIEIQEGKFIDAIRVDKSTIRWCGIMDSDELIPYIRIKNINICSERLEPGRYVTGIQMFHADGELQFSMNSLGTNQDGTKLSGERVQRVIRKNFDPDTAVNTFAWDLSLDMRDIITGPPAPIGGFGIYTKISPDQKLITRLKIYSPDYTNMVDEENFDKYVKIFELERNSN